MRIKLKYLQRLGDICQCLASAKALHDQGHEVFFECWPCYADILKCCSFVKYVNPYGPPQKFDREFNLAIHPDGGGTQQRYNEFRRSGIRWSEFIIDRVPELKGTYGPPPFDRIEWFDRVEYGLPKRYALVAPYGYSQQVKHDPAKVIALAQKMYAPLPVFVLNDRPAIGAIYAKRLRDLPGMIKTAARFMSINTSTAIMAAGVRKEYEHVPQTGAAAQDDTAFEGISKIVSV